MMRFLLSELRPGRAKSPLLPPPGSDPRPGDDAKALQWRSLAEPLPDMAFVADRHIVERYAATRFAGAPIDPRFAVLAET